MSINIFNKSKQKGFTLVEMIVSMAIFIVVALIAVGALLKVLDANRKSLNLKTAINNLNFALESMSREMRVGGDYYLQLGSQFSSTDSYPVERGDFSFSFDPEHPNDGWIVYFRPPNVSNIECDVMYAYRLKDGEKLQKAQQRVGIDGGCLTLLEEDFYDLFPPELKILQSKVMIYNYNQPYATFWFKGVIGSKEKDTTEFSIQTSISQRINGLSGN